MTYNVLHNPIFRVRRGKTVEKKTVQFGVRIPQHLADDIDRLAALERRPRSHYILNALLDKVEQEQLKAEKAS